MADTLRSQTVRGLFWSFLESAGLRMVQFAVGVVLARILFPEQFGLIGMLAIFIAVAQTFLDSGFGAALIQKRDVTATEICSIFYFNVLAGLISAGILCWVAPLIADFFKQPILTPLTRLLSLILVINSFGLIQGTILVKQINFKANTQASLVASVLSGAIGIILAVSGFGIWSLAVQQILSSFFRTSFLWFLSSWRPALIFSFKSLRKLFGFGSKMLISGLLNEIFNNCYLLVIGRLFSATDLGFFTRAKTLGELPSHTLSGMVGRVTFPAFSIIQNDPVRLRRGLKNALVLLVMVNFPMMICLLVIARPLVLLLLTEKWAESIPYLQLFCLVGIMFPLHLINLNVLQALGRSDLFLRLELIKKFLIIINLSITWQWGISAMICGMIITSLLSYYLNSYYTGPLVNYGIREQFCDFAMYLIMAALMAIAVYAVGLLPFPNLWTQLLVQIAVGMLSYLGLCRLFRLPDFMVIWQAGRNIFASFFVKGKAA
ncbi:MAG: lipopolysaccharide biosynthesis protein [Deltaproteobacteria bacterium]|nr:lipopolysaccharide biosynthesis protein [Deltaproteobacteria bacterium]